MINTIDKGRYWWCVLYPENMINDWESKIAHYVQLPFSYCIHDQDLTNDPDETRKVHVHCIIAFPNTTTKKHAAAVFSTLALKDCKAFNDIEAVINIRHCYDYLIHHTDECIAMNKFQYDSTLRKCGNNFDIGAFEQESVVDTQAKLDQLSLFIIEKRFCNWNDFYLELLNNFDVSYRLLARANHGFLMEFIRGNYYLHPTKRFVSSTPVVDRPPV